nr:steroid 21-hydroxylase-like [Lytechinus pictus]
MIVRVTDFNNVLNIQHYHSEACVLINNLTSIQANGLAHDETQTFVHKYIKNPEFMRNEITPRMNTAITGLISQLQANPDYTKVITPMLGYADDLFHRITFNEVGSYDLAQGTFGSDLSILALQLFNPQLFIPTPGNSPELNIVKEYLQDQSVASAGDKKSLVGLYHDYINNLESPIARPEDVWRHMMDLFVGGRTNIGVGLAFIIYRLAEDQNLQDRIRKEISKFEDNVNYDDRFTNFPETMSFIYEIYRFHPLVPLGVTHVASADGKIGGIDINKDTRILPNIYSIHNDPLYWKSPEVFNTTRFLQLNDGDLTFDSGSANATRVVSFSTGRRSCPGELLARNIFFKTTLRLVQNFRMSLMPSVNVNINEVYSALFMKPPEYQAKFDPIL